MRNEDKKFWITILLSIFISLIGGLSSYFNALGAIKDDNKKTIENFRIEVREQYASKEEIKFIREILTEVKDQLKEIDKKISRAN